MENLSSVSFQSSFLAVRAVVGHMPLLAAVVAASAAALLLVGTFARHVTFSSALETAHIPVTGTRVSLVWAVSLHVALATAVMAHGGRLAASLLVVAIGVGVGAVTVHVPGATAAVALGVTFSTSLCSSIARRSNVLVRAVT